MNKFEQCPVWHRYVGILYYTYQGLETGGDGDLLGPAPWLKQWLRKCLEDNIASRRSRRLIRLVDKGRLQGPLSTHIRTHATLNQTLSGSELVNLCTRLASQGPTGGDEHLVCTTRRLPSRLSIGACLYRHMYVYHHFLHVLACPSRPVSKSSQQCFYQPSAKADLRRPLPFLVRTRRGLRGACCSCCMLATSISCLPSTTTQFLALLPATTGPGQPKTKSRDAASGLRVHRFQVSRPNPGFTVSSLPIFAHSTPRFKH
jgi:hypothetical protein